MQAQHIPKHLASHPQSKAQLTPWQAVEQRLELPADKAAAVTAEMQQLVDAALQQGNATSTSREAAAQSSPTAADQTTAFRVLPASSFNARQALDNADAAPPAGDTGPRPPGPHQQDGQATSKDNVAAGSSDSVPGAAAGMGSKTKAAKAKSKPCWAQSEHEAAETEAREEGELLDFAEGLDFDSFVQELEDKDLQAAIEVRVATRI